MDSNSKIVEDKVIEEKVVEENKQVTLEELQKEIKEARTETFALYLLIVMLSGCLSLVLF